MFLSSLSLALNLRIRYTGLPMKHILLFGAGKSATVLIDYLKNISIEKNWRVTIADVNPDAIRSKLGEHELVKAVIISIEREKERQALIATADVVISLLPAALHYLVAMDCLLFSKHLLTASYVDETIRAISDDIKKKGILFLCEMGLDPGIDHMSAMQLLNQLKEKGAKINSFVSHCGGLVSPESDDNPWHYKISWNPKNVVMAGKAGAEYLEELQVKNKKYSELFVDCEQVFIEGVGNLAYYPNRDSLSYLPNYQLADVETFIRTTLRHPDFCKGWQKIVELGLTDENILYQTDSLAVSSFWEMHLKPSAAGKPLSDVAILEQFEFLGLHDETLINKGSCSAAAILQFILESKWLLQPGDKDMVVMLHEIGYTLNDEKQKAVSTLVVKGEDHLRTAMAKTVGLPLGIAATLLLEGKIKETGLHIPIMSGIYEPVLKALECYGIIFHEKLM